MSQPTTDIIVPGSTSNLGPGFDALSVAVDLYLRVRVMEVVPTTASCALDMEFSGHGPTGENRIETAFRHAERRLGPADASLRVQVTSDIPMAAGLGSSAAASLAGLRLYELATGASLALDDLLTMASELEGHPDNAAAALLGGIVVSCQCEHGRVIARSWDWPAAVRLVVATPDFTLQTKQARGVLPAEVPLGDAVANLQHALLLVRALETGRYEDIREALKDRLHQPARTALVPGLREALEIDHPAVLGVCLSGAGPSVLALAAPGRSDEAAATLRAVYQRLGVRHTIRNLAAHANATQPSIRTTEREKTA